MRITSENYQSARTPPLDGVASVVPSGVVVESGVVGVMVESGVVGVVLGEVESGVVGVVLGEVESGVVGTV